MDEKILEKYYMAKEKMKDLEELLEYYKEIIEEHLDKEGIDRIKTPQFTVDRRTMTIERMSKKNCPKEIWNDYCSSSTSRALFITKNGIKRRRRKAKSN
jgi:hypothetical protein